MWLACALALQLSTTAAAAPAAAAAGAGKPTLMVLSFRDNGVGANAVETIAATLVAHLANDGRVRVMSTEDVRRLLDTHTAKLELGCEDDACMAEIAGALGAQLTIYGTAGTLGDLVVVTMSLFDARAGTSIARETVEVRSLDALPAPLRSAGDRLLARLDPPSAAAQGPSALLIGGAALGAVGLAAGVVGSALWLPNIDGYANDEANPTFESKSASRRAETTGAALAASGAGALVVGAALLGMSLAFE